MPPLPLASPGYQFCTVEYLISASSSATSSTTAACSWFSSHIGALVGDDQRALELAGVLLVYAKVSGKLHRAAHARRHVDERAVGEHRRVERGVEIVRHRHDRAEIFAHQLGMLAQRLG